MSRITAVLFITAVAFTSGAAPAGAASHTVSPGETLWSIAQADGLSPQALAAANGLPTDAHLVAQSAITIPAASGAGAGVPTGAGQGSVESDGDDTAPAAAVASSGLVVQPGDTLSAIAARLGASPAELAAANGLSVGGILPAGASLRAPGAMGASAGPVHITTGAPVQSVTAAPVPTPGFASGSQIANAAAAHGVPASLAQAIAWQESGFNNGLVSSADARGVMQITPPTWSFVQRNLASSPLNPLSPADNVTGGVLYLRYLLRAAGGDPTTAIAGYYQGLGSVRRRGMFADTQRYVGNVLALRQRFARP
jgi:LysM repeat protein